MCNIIRHTLRHNAPSPTASPRPHINDPVAPGNKAHIVLGNQNGIVAVHQITQVLHQPVCIKRVQAGCWFVQHIKRVTAPLFLQLRRQLDPLRLPAGKFGCRLP